MSETSDRRNRFHHVRRYCVVYYSLLTRTNWKFMARTIALRDIAYETINSINAKKINCPCNTYLVLSRPSYCFIAIVNTKVVVHFDLINTLVILVER